MAIKSVSIRMEEEMLRKLGYVADYEGRSVRNFEREHGEISGDIKPDMNVKPGKKVNN